MSYQFSESSLILLNTCHPIWVAVMHVVIKHVDIKVITGHRDEVGQQRMYDAGRSKLQWPDSKHNSYPSLAIDVVPYPVIWPDQKKRPRQFVAEMARFARLAGYVQAVCNQLGHECRWGGDWDRDWDLTDNVFNDYPHYELVNIDG